MCSIFGVYDVRGRAEITAQDVRRAQSRGRDSWGVGNAQGEARRSLQIEVPESFSLGAAGGWVIGNTRAEPTTEWVENKTLSDVQPISAGPFTVAHNGTFANDEELARRAGVDISRVSSIDTARWAHALHAGGASTPDDVFRLLDDTVGSYGIAVGHESGWMLLAANYRPIWLSLREGVLRFSSVAPRDLSIIQRLAEGWQMLPPYSAIICDGGELRWVDRKPAQRGERTLVVASGGLDSTVAATLAVRERGSASVDLLHITYGCRAEDREVSAVQKIAERLGTGLRMLDLSEVFRAVGSSRLTSTLDAPIAEGEAGAEYASEWVPARNLILTSIAVGIAEGQGYSRLMLGNNIEEAGAYPDNESEFIGRISDLLPFAVADSRSVKIEEPVGLLTKREIVASGIAAGAPLDLTWSCYRDGDLHCGVCGPCYMRRTAFSMAGVDDPLGYED